MNSFYSQVELKKLKLKTYGKNVLISRKASFYEPGMISIGSNVRIDDFCVLSGSITIGNYVHISAFSALYGKMGIIIGNYCGLSPRCTIFSATDNFSGNYMVSPMVPDKYTKVTGGLVTIADYVQVGTNSIIMPALTIKEGAAIGAFTFVNRSLASWKIYTGIPAKMLENRSKKILKFASKIRQ